MKGGTLLVSRAVNLFPQLKKRLEALGFQNVEATGEERDSLNMVINEKKPNVVLVGAGFYHAATPVMMGQVVKRFPKLNIAALAVHEYPESIAAWFIFYGVKSYISLWEEGLEQFRHGLELVREGKEYISPRVKELIDHYSEWPEIRFGLTGRLKAVLVFLCGGFKADSIGAELHLSRKTVYNHMERLYTTLNASCRDELVARAWQLHLITEKDLCFYDRRVPEGGLLQNLLPCRFCSF